MSDAIAPTMPEEVVTPNEETEEEVTETPSTPASEEEDEDFQSADEVAE